MHCPVCQSENLTEETSFTMYHDYGRFLTTEAGWFGKKKIHFQAERARVCLDCGHLFLFVGNKALDRLRHREKPRD